MRIFQTDDAVKVCGEDLIEDDEDDEDGNGENEKDDDDADKDINYDGLRALN